MIFDEISGRRSELEGEAGVLPAIAEVHTPKTLGVHSLVGEVPWPEEIPNSYHIPGSVNLCGPASTGLVLFESIQEVLLEDD